MVTLSDDKDKTPFTNEELFEALEEYTSALEKCKELEEGSQKLQKSENITSTEQCLKGN